MKKFIHVKTLLGLSMLLSSTAWAATNTATNATGGGVTLTDSGTVTVTAATFTLIKQVYVSGTCMASSDTSGGADSCNSNASTVIVPGGSAIQFVIYVRNTSDVALSDVRFQDVLATGAGNFTYSAGTIKYNAASSDVAAATTVYTNVNGGTAQTDAVNAADDYASMVSNTLTVGAVTGQVNASLSVAAHKTVAIIFNATKN